MIYSNEYLPFSPNRAHGDLRFISLLLKIPRGTRIASPTFNPHPFPDLYYLWYGVESRRSIKCIPLTIEILA